MFRKGDVVKCVNAADQEILEEGAVYLVTGANRGYVNLALKEHGKGWMAYRFAPFVPPPDPDVKDLIDEYRRTNA